MVGADVQTDGSLSIGAELNGTVASARHVSNSSDLKATLLSLLISFWKYLLGNRGGLSLLLFDDLQELFDPINRRRLANEVPRWVEAGARPIITTNDPQFRHRMLESSIEKLGTAQVDHRQIHPLKPARDHMELGRFTEAIQIKKRLFESDAHRNEDQYARDYMNSLRIYLEDRLMDFFDSPDPDLPRKATLSDLISALRRRVGRGSAPFCSVVFQELAAHRSLNAGSEFLTVMNMCHHRREQEITYNDIWGLRAECSEIMELADAAYSDYEHHLRGDLRDVPGGGDSAPRQPAPISIPTFSVPMLTHVAAFTEETPAGDVVLSNEAFTADFTNHALYLINTHNLGPSGPINSRAIVDLSDDEIDNSLAVVLHRQEVYARRIFRLPGGRVILFSEAENPLKRPPPLILPQTEVRILKIAGFLFESRPLWIRERSEAILLDQAFALTRVKVAFKIRGSSAVPLALDGQTILAGEELELIEYAEMVGRIVVITSPTGMSLKRMGKTLESVPYVRCFTSVGGSGDPLLLRTEDVEGGLTTVPMVTSAREVLGVIYLPL